ncbi:MAG: SEC59/DGK1/VTE5 family protein [Oscillatoria sp. PMC 1051.18]|nr:SEC59/DGK1/VTE5 family protein [Oscillatoria sp. PMC 1050.18]MEC5029017.1 SEC59/DGK1/VTE5 family protein [Oscillatoria sp. PMC 1051.18]
MVESTTSLSWLTPLSVTTLYLVVIVLLAEGLNRLSSTDAEFTRKVVHIGVGNVIILAWWLEIPAWVGIGAAAIASLIALVSYFLPILPSINSVGRQSLGTFFYALSVGILVAWFFPQNLPEYAAIGILVMAWGDGLAAVIGRRFGKHRYQVWGIGKSWEGSLTMTVVSFVVCSLILMTLGSQIAQIILVSSLVAIAATTLEAFSKLGIDNLTVPLGSAALSFFLMQLW